MAQDFVVFLLLSVATFVLLVWLTVRVFKVGKKSSEPKKRALGGSAANERSRKIDRVAKRVTPSSIPTYKAPPRKSADPRAVTIVFYADQEPLAVLKVASLRAIAWGRERQALDGQLGEIVQELLKPEAGDSVTVFVMPIKVSDETPLRAVAFDEEGSALGEKSVELTFGAFPQSQGNESLLGWVKAELQCVYHKAFMALEAPEQAKLIALEGARPQQLAQANLQTQSIKDAYQALLLMKLMDEGTQTNRQLLLNTLLKLPNAEDLLNDHSEVGLLYRLINQQTFVQTQKLLNLWVLTTNTSGTWSKALNF